MILLACVILWLTCTQLTAPEDEWYPYLKWTFYLCCAGLVGSLLTGHGI